MSIGTAAFGVSEPHSYAMLTVDDGLPASNVTSVLQDSHGYIWFGTSAGLSKYDGIHMTVFGLQDGLPDINIRTLFEDAQGRIWVNSEGLICYIENGQVQIPKHLDNQNASISLHKGPKSEIWMFGAEDILRWDTNTILDSLTRPKRLSPPDNHKWKKPQFLGQSGDTIWMYNQDSLGGVLIQFIEGIPLSVHPLLFEPKSPAYFKASLITQNQILYTATEGLILFDKHRGQRILYSANGLGMNTGQIEAFVLDHTYRIWMADNANGMKYLQLNTSAGMDSISISGYPIVHDLDARVRGFLEDKERNIWFLTREKGVGFLPGNASFVRNINTRNGLREDVVLSLASELGQNIWLGHQNGTIEYLNYTGIGGIRPVIGNSGAAPIRTLKEVQGGIILAGSEEGLFLVQFSQAKRLGPIRDVTIIDQDLLGNIYIGTTNYLYRFDYKELRELDKYEYEKDISANRIIANRGITALCTGPDRQCWYSNKDGLFYYDGFETVNLSRTDSRLSGGISDLVYFSETIAVATRGNGIILINSKTNAISQLSTTSGLPSNVCTDLFSVNDTTFWVATNRGIAKLQGQNFMEGDFHYIAYDSKDGLITNEINSLWLMRGVLYLGTNAGLSIFRESDFRTADVPPGIYLISVGIGDLDTLLLETYKVPYSKNSLAVQYSG
ncbi:MAG: ligand-binding sensor domain-containing protein, partial [Limisphaerales bacterium]